MVRALNLLGIAASAYFTNASTDTDPLDQESRTSVQLFLLGLPQQDWDEDGVVGEEKWWLMFDFNGDTLVENAYEASVSAAAYYYAVWPSLSAGTKCRLLRQMRVPEILAASFPEIMAPLGAVISGSVASQRRGAMGLLAARDKEDDQNAGSGSDSDTS